MLKPLATVLLTATLMFGLFGCRDEASFPVEAGTGPNPELPPPRQRLLPTVVVAHAIGWPEGGTPKAAEGLKVERFAEGLDHPRWLYVLPNGDVLVAETNTPAPPEQTGLSAWITKAVMRWAGAGLPSPNRIILLRDADGNGAAETKSTLLSGLNSPFGMALVGDALYVADTDAVLRFPYHEGDTSIAVQGTKIADLPAGPYNYHWTKSLVASPDGSRLFVASARTAMPGRMGSMPKPGAPPFSRSILRPARLILSLPACAIRSASRSSRRAARSGSQSTSGTNSAATSSPTI